jgi:hypothetical protein
MEAKTTKPQEPSATSAFVLRPAKFQVPLPLEADQHAQDQREAQAPNCFHDRDMASYHSINLSESG